MDLGISFFNEWHPELLVFFTFGKDQLPVAFIGGQAVIDDHISPLRVLEETQDIDALGAEFVENRREDSCR